MTFAATLSASDSAILDEAIRWAVRLQSGVVGEHDRRACDAWRVAHPLHEEAWQQVQAVEQVFRNASPSGHLAYAVLQGAAARGPMLSRRGMLKAFGLGAIGLALGGTMATWQERARYATAVGERRSVTLADGSRLQLNTGSAVDVVFSPLRRLLALQRGELLIETGSDPDSPFGARPFFVETADTRLEAAQARFGVRLVPGSTQLHVESGSVAILGTGVSVLQVRAGESYGISAEAAPQRLAHAGFDPTAWADGVLIAQEMRLDAFVRELARYRGAPLYCDPRVAGLRISGVFRLDGSDPAERVLAAIARTLPVRLRRGMDGAVTLLRA